MGAPALAWAVTEATPPPPAPSPQGGGDSKRGTIHRPHACAASGLRRRGAAGASPDDRYGCFAFRLTSTAPRNRCSVRTGGVGVFHPGFPRAPGRAGPKSIGNPSRPRLILLGRFKAFPTLSTRLVSRAVRRAAWAAPLDSISIAASGRYQAPSSAMETRMIMRVVLSASDWRARLFFRALSLLRFGAARTGMECGGSPFDASLPQRQNDSKDCVGVDNH